MTPNLAALKAIECHLEGQDVSDVQPLIVPTTPTPKPHSFEELLDNTDWIDQTKLTRNGLVADTARAEIEKIIKTVEARHLERIMELEAKSAVSLSAAFFVNFIALADGSEGVMMGHALACANALAALANQYSAATAQRTRFNGDAEMVLRQYIADPGAENERLKAQLAALAPPEEED
ncbi:hypothetical protein VTI74DRAFT_9737 [Chaetomium olivicolor]